MNKKFLFLLLSSFLYTGFAQTIDNISPYSYFGIGNQNSRSSINANNMGGLNTATNYTNEINFQNPAAASALEFTVFSVSGGTKFFSLSNESDKQKNNYTSLGSLGLGIPIAKKAGLMAGLQPNTSVGYSIISENLDENNNIIDLTHFEGSGGTNRFFIGAGYEVAKGLTLGLQWEYLFGQVNNSALFSSTETTLNSRYKHSLDITSDNFILGAQYNYDLSEEVYLNAGVTYSLENESSTNLKEYLYSFTYGQGVEVPIDTLLAKEDISGKIKHPAQSTFAIGIGKKDKWYIGTQYETQAALDFDLGLSYNAGKVQYDTYSKYVLGGYWTPKKYSITSYWERITYRMGLRFENTGLLVKVDETSTEYTPLNDFGISFGLSLPMKNQLSQVNLGVEYGKRGEKTDGLIQENYFNLRLSLSLADKWFIKRKIN